MDSSSEVTYDREALIECWCSSLGTSYKMVKSHTQQEGFSV